MTDGHPRELFESALTGELEGSAAERLAAHLRSCPECAAEMTFARRLRGIGAASRAAGLTPTELDRMEERVFRRIAAREPEGIARLLTRPMLAWGMAAALALWFVASGGPRWTADRWSVRQSLALENDPMGAGRARLVREALGDAFGAPGRPATLVVAEFATAASLAGLVFGDGAAPGLAEAPELGRRALRLGLAGPSSAPLELAIPYRHAPVPGAVSVVAWVKDQGGEAQASLAVVLKDGRLLDCPPRRWLGSGGWSWVVFRLPPEAAGADLREFRLAFAGSGTVSLARLELWCGPPPGEG